MRPMSPSVWRVWIEMMKTFFTRCGKRVTLRVEGVD